MSTYTIATLATRAAQRAARRLGPKPQTRAERRKRADDLMSTGAVGLSALAAAWYAGNVGAARADIYGTELSDR
jgi:hypothetical protein